jgi:outer membrane protein TolC
MHGKEKVNVMESPHPRAIISMLIFGLMLGWIDASLAVSQSAVDPNVPELRLSLRDAMEAAVGNNPNVRLFKEKVEAARAVSFTQLGALLPNLSSNVRQSQQTFFFGTIGLAPVVSDPFSIFDARANLTQNIFSLSLIDRWRASRTALKVAEFESETTRLDTMAEAGLAYMEVLRAQETAKAREANVKLFEELTELARNRRGGGMATGLDTARAEAQLENERQHLAMARNQVEQYKLSLINALGVSFDVRLTLTDEFKIDAGVPSSQMEALAAALEQRIEIKAQHQRIRTAELSLRSTTNERLPSLVGQGDYGLIGNRMHNTAATYNVAVMLSVPIFDGGQREGRISEARSLAQQELFKMASIQNKVTFEVREALVTLNSSREQLDIARRGLEFAFAEQEIARQRFTVLTSQSNLELTNALYSLARARENAVDALFRLNASRINLARAIGQMDKLH